jgi:hypothetical protein
MHTPHDQAANGGNEAAMAESLRRGHDQRDLAVKPILVFCLVLVISIFVIQMALIGFQKLLEHQEFAAGPQKVSSVAQKSIADSMKLKDRSRPNEPRLQPSPFHERFDHDDLAALLQTWDAQLNTVGGFESEPGRAHVPVDRVIQSAMEKGIGSLKGVATTQPAGQAAVNAK